MRISQVNIEKLDAEKLLSAWQLPPPVLRENRYSFKKTAAIIFDAMERVVARR